MADVYSLLTNQYVKSIVRRYVVNSREYKEYYLSVLLKNFFKFDFDINLIVYIDDFLYNVRWYISESYLKDIRTLNWKVDLKEFWSKLQPHWYEGIFLPNPTWIFTSCLYIRFVLSDSIRNLECCLVYKKKKEFYRLAISHEYIESSFFNKRFYGLCNRYVPVLKEKIDYNKAVPKLREVYNTIVASYKEFPEKYAIKDGFLVLKRS